MILYILVLTLIVSGSSVFIFSKIKLKVANQLLTLYDARGFFVVAMLFVIFAATSLAFFWGEMRFAEPQQRQLSFAVFGVLYTLIGCLVGLGIGLTKLKEVDPA